MLLGSYICECGTLRDYFLYLPQVDIWLGESFDNFTVLFSRHHGINPPVGRSGNDPVSTVHLAIHGTYVVNMTPPHMKELTGQCLLNPRGPGIAMNALVAISKCCHFVIGYICSCAGREGCN
jgi:hypothetical protein